MNTEAVIARTVARLLNEEGFRQYPYDDSTGKRVSCQPSGNLTWLVGCNLESSGSLGLAEVVLEYQIGETMTALAPYAWFTALDEIRASVIADLAFNNGIPHLLHYINMIAALVAQNWDEAAAQLLDSNAARALPQRYDALAQLLKTGQEIS